MEGALFLGCHYSLLRSHHIWLIILFICTVAILQLVAVASTYVLCFIRDLIIIDLSAKHSSEQLFKLVLSHKSNMDCLAI